MDKYQSVLDRENFPRNTRIGKTVVLFGSICIHMASHHIVMTIWAILIIFLILLCFCSSLKRDGIRRVKQKKYPEGAVYESCSAMQCVCPVCPYGQGRGVNFLPFKAATKKELVTCDVCGTEYYSLEPKKGA